MTIFLTILCLLLCSFCAFLGYSYWRVRKQNKELLETVDEYARAIQQGQKAIDLALKYEEFYQNTVGEVGDVVDSLDQLMNRRFVLSDDPDVQNLFKLVGIIHATLLGYLNAKVPEETTESKSNTET